MRGFLAALAAIVATATIVVGPTTGEAMAGGPAVAQEVNNHATAPSLSLAVGQKGDPEVAAIGKHATLLYYTIVRGKWRRTQVAGPGTAQSGPSLVSEAHGNAAIAVEGPHNALLLFTLRGGHWSRQTIPGSGAWSAPSLANGLRGPAVAVDGPNNSLWFYWLVNGIWHTTQVLAAASAYSAPSLVVRDKHQAVYPGGPTGEADIAVEGPAHDLVYAHAIPGLTTWTTLTGENLAFSAPSLVVTDGADVTQGVVFIVVQGPRHRIVWVIDQLGLVRTFDSAKTNDTVYSAPAVAQNLADVRRPFVITYQGRASKVFDLVLLNTSPLYKYDLVGSVHADSAPAAAAGASKASTDDIIVEGAGNTLWYFQGSKSASSTGVPRFTGVEIGGGGSTFGG